MLVQKWMLPTLNEILAKKFDCAQSTCSDSSRKLPLDLEAQAEQEWQAAVAATEDFLLQTIGNSDCTPSPQGVVFAGSSPLWSNRALLHNLPTWVFVAQRAETNLQLPPAKVTISNSIAAPQQIPLLKDDPLAEEQFCLVLTAKFSLLLVLGVDSSGNKAFRFSFQPEEANKVWQLLRSRLRLINPQLAKSSVDALVEKFYPVAPDYRVVTEFSHLLLQHSQLKANKQEALVSENSHRSDIELLQAFAHEVRTPLTTIRTLTRLILKRQDLAPEVKKRLEVIDSECTEQVNRMELIFRAAELVEKSAAANSVGLTAMSLAQVLQQSIPRWQQQAHRRNLTLDVVLPQQMPTVVSDPTILDQVLTSLIENFTRNLTAGSHIQVQVIPAGNQLKLQLLHQSVAGGDKSASPHCVAPTVKSLGPLLMFQPETGNISLNLNAAKYLFQAIGGKLIVRQRPHEGEVLTIFLPMDLSHSPLYQPSC